MKLNISYPLNNTQKVVEIDDENRLRSFYDKRISHEVSGDSLGDDFKGYIFRISGGNDKQGFAMQQGVMANGRVRLLVTKGSKSYRPRKRGERKRKSVRGCIVGADLGVLNLVILKKGDKDIEGVTDATKPLRLGPKRASKIRKLFNLEKKDDVRKAVIRRQISKDGKKPTFKAPKIQRLITPQRLQHRRALYAEKKRRWESTKKDSAAYNELVQKRFKEARDARSALHAKNRSESRKISEKSSGPVKTAPVAATKADVKAKTAAAAPAKAAPTAAKPAAKAAPVAAKAAPTAAKSTAAQSKQDDKKAPPKAAPAKK